MQSRSKKNTSLRSKRVRRSREESRRLILESAERLLAAGGPSAVEVRAVANDLGVTDAAVHHHFGTRDQLLEALLRHGGRKLRSDVERLTRQWAGGPPDLARLVDLLADLYAASGYAKLALALHLSGWRDRGAGLLAPVVDVLHAAQRAQAAASGLPPPPREDTQMAVAALHQALAMDPLFGAEFRRSAGLTLTRKTGARLQRAWWLAALGKALSLAVLDRGSL
jgi:AcrR family transcriptional regulator